MPYVPTKVSGPYRACTYVGDIRPHCCHTDECRYPAVFHRDSEKQFEQVMWRIATRIFVINADNRFAHAENSGHYIRIICGYYLYDAIEATQDTLAAILGKVRFWERFAKQPLNQRQIKILNRLLDGLIKDDTIKDR